MGEAAIGYWLLAIGYWRPRSVLFTTSQQPIATSHEPPLRVLRGVHFAFLILNFSLLAVEAPPPSDTKTGGAPQKPRDLGDLIDSIPMGALEGSIVVQSGELKVAMSTVGKVESAYVAASRRERPKFSLTPGHQTALRKSLAFQLLCNAALEKYAADNKLVLPKDDFDARYEKFKATCKGGPSASYEQYLADMGLTDEDLRRYWQAYWAVEQKLTQDLTDEDIAKAVEQRKDYLKLRRASHIVFGYKGAPRASAATTRTKEEALAAAEAVIKKLANGEDFAKLAETCGDAPNKAADGDLGYFPRKGPGALVGPLAEAIYKLEKAGDYTPVPVETAFGFHVARLTALQGGGDLKAETRRALVVEKMNKQLQQLNEETAAAAKFNAKLFQ